MRILLLNYEYPPLGGGAANATKYILREYAGMPGLEVDLVTSAVGQAEHQQLGEGVNLHFLDIGKRGSLHYQTARDLLTYSWRALHHARMLQSRHAYDLCHAFFGVPCGFLARRLRMPYIVSLRGSDVPFYNPRFRWPDRLLFRRLSRGIWRDAAAVVANSTGLRELALETAPSVPIRIIPNGVDTSTFQAASLPGQAPRPLRVLCVARLIPRKGIGYLLRAIAELPADSVSLTLVGTGAQEAELHALAGELGISGAAHFMGHVEQENLPAIYQNHHVFVLPSINEGMSNTVLEAMASGLPLVLTDTGGSSELLEDGRNGFTIAMRSSEDISRRLTQYLNEPGLLARQGLISREKAEGMSWRRVAEAYCSLYQETAS